MAPRTLKFQYSRSFLLQKSFAVKQATSNSYVQQLRELLKREDLQEIRKRRRGGSKKLSILYVNAHGRQNLLRSCSERFLAKHGVTFFGETWLTEARHTVCMAKKSSFVQHATTTTGRGRPSGGLEAYVTEALEPTLLYQSDMILALAIRDLSLAGCYFKPSLDIDDIVNDLANLLQKVQNPEKVLLIGDFNLKPDSVEFLELCTFLEQYNIRYRSDPHEATFIYASGASTLDHVFTSDAMDLVTTLVHEMAVSDHKPISAIVRIPCRRNSKSNSVLHVLPKINIEETTKKLESFGTGQISPEQLSEILTPQRLNYRPLHPRKKPWFSPYLRELKAHTFSLLKEVRLGTPVYAKYSVARSAYHKALRQAELQWQIEELENVIEECIDGDMNPLYKKTRASASGSIICLETFLVHCQSLFQSFPQPEFPAPPSMDVDDCDLTLPITPNEVELALERQKSRAPGMRGYSPWHLKTLGKLISTDLSRIFSACISSITFPAVWLNSTLFFLFKRGNRSDPNNYRSIRVQDPFLKIFSSVLNERLVRFVESRALLPRLQFGFTKGKGTVGAIALLQEIMSRRLTNKKRTYVAFIDFSKAFDLVNRIKLMEKLHRLGIPQSFSRLIFNILQNTKLFLRSGDRLSPGFYSYNGVPQGDPCSPVLFNLFLHDLPDHLHHVGVSIDGISIPVIMYADDVCLIGESKEDLQKALDDLEIYCGKNHLQVNAPKTKILVSHKGRLPECVFHLNGRALERVNEFNYLGFTLSSQLVSSGHLHRLNTKARARIGFLFSCLNLKHLPFSLVVRVFQVYILPIYEYALPVWITSSVSQNAWGATNSVFSKYLKRYLGLPYSSNNAILYFLTGSCPIKVWLEGITAKRLAALQFGNDFSGLRLSLFDRLPNHHPDFDLLPSIPSYFWRSRTIPNIPINPTRRRNIFKEALDSDHRLACSKKEFHLYTTEACRCVDGGDNSILIISYISATILMTIKHRNK